MGFKGSLGHCIRRKDMPSNTQNSPQSATSVYPTQLLALNSNKRHKLTSRYSTNLASKKRVHNMRIRLGFPVKRTQLVDNFHDFNDHVGTLLLFVGLIAAHYTDTSYSGSI